MSVEPDQVHWRAWNLAGLGWVALLAGDAARATVRLQDSLALANDLGDKRGLSLVLHALGLVAWSQDDVVQATLRLRESLTLRRQLGDRLGIAECLEGLALVAGGQGAAAGATRLLGAAAALRQAIGVPQPPIERAAYEATVGAARAVLGEQRFAMAWTAGQALPLEQALHEALAWEPVPAPALPLSLPRTERALGQPAGACLTAREQEIAALVARGLTNRQIAIELSISERTAGTHLANILGKLGFATRAQVAVWVVDQGLRPAQPG